MMTDLPDRIWSRIDASGDCWDWTGPERNGRGYGACTIDKRSYYVHRYVYETLVGPVPDGLFIDHLCMNKSCVNPDHLEAVSWVENKRRARKHCRSWHSDEYYRKDAKYPSCRNCKNAAARRRRARKASLVSGSTDVEESPVGATRAQRTEGGN